MPQRLQLTGQTFSRLTVLRLWKVTGGYSHWICQCSCGEKTIVCGKKLVSGHTRSCGCLLSEVTIARNIKGKKHGEAGRTAEYYTWVSMICRCNKPHKYYFDRGIRVCSRWKDYRNFLKDMGRRPGPGYSIERKNNDRGYFPSNCKWGTAKEQANNRRPVSRKLQLKVKRAGDKGRRLWSHNYWHIRRGMKSEKCSLC